MKNRIKYIIPSFLTLLPILFGVYVWDKLPEKIAVHWGANYQPDGFANKGFAVFFIPLFLLLLYWLCLLLELKIGKNHQNPKLMAIVLYIIPAISLVMNIIMYTYALGRDINVGLIISVFFGILFIIIGNYLPKCKQNKTLGIKLPWTLNSEENWHATHRFAGKVWVICGFSWLIFALLLPKYVIYSFAIVLIAVIVPTVYSYLYHKKTK